MATVDIALYQPEAPGTPYTPAIATLTSSGRRLSGAEKLAQRFLLELTTEKGSMTFSPTRGCNFLSVLRAGGIVRHEGDILTVFYSSLLDITNNLTAEELDTDPDDERFSSAELARIEINTGNITLQVSLHSRSNQVSTITFPVQFYTA